MTGRHDVTSRPWPTVAEVEASNDVRQVLGWNRFLPSPTKDEQIPVLHAVVKRLGELRDQDPDAYVRASKSLGWG